MTDVTVVIGAGSIGVAIARRVSSGKHVLLADLRLENADAAAEVPRTQALRPVPPSSTSRRGSRCSRWSRSPPAWAR